MALLISASASVALPTCKGSPASEWDKILGGRNFIKSNWHNCIGDHEEKISILKENIIQLDMMADLQ